MAAKTAQERPLRKGPVIRMLAQVQIVLEFYQCAANMDNLGVHLDFKQKINIIVLFLVKCSIVFNR